MYRCKTYSGALREEEHRFKMPEKALPREIFGPRNNEVINYWRKLHSQDHHSFNLT
jgi:hypothetical protein